jgi:uncharacterized RDD family membrane protein YckC
MNENRVPVTIETYGDPALFEGVRTRRFMAFLVDATLIMVLTGFASIAVFLLGIVTFGLGWLLFGIVFPGVALLYTGLTLGGAASATPGMRLVGLEMRTLDGAKVGFLLAVLHALIFWFLTFVLLNVLILVVSLLNERKRLLHDILVGTVVMRADRVPGPARQAAF